MSIDSGMPPNENEILRQNGAHLNASFGGETTLEEATDINMNTHSLETFAPSRIAKQGGVAAGTGR